jgi:hypothetical protein
MKRGDMLVCIFWGMQHVPSTRICCSRCSNDIAMDNANQILHQQFQLEPTCPSCFLEMADPICGGGAIGGEAVNIAPFRPPEWFLEHMRGVVRRFKARSN